MDYESFFESAVDRLKAERRYRVFADLERIAGRFPAAIWHAPAGPREITVWCSNDYLGMGQHPAVVRAMTETAMRARRRRRRHAQHLGQQPPGGRARGRARRPPRQGGGARLHLGLHLERGRHRDDRPAHPGLPDPVGRPQPRLDDRGRAPVRLRQARSSATTTSPTSRSSCAAAGERPKLIVFESVYSMDGDVAPIHAICDLAERYGAMTYLDEVHAVGMYGAARRRRRRARRRDARGST